MRTNSARPGRFQPIGQHRYWWHRVPGWSTSGAGGTTLSQAGFGGATGAYGGATGNSGSDCASPRENNGTACVSSNLCASGTVIQPTSGTTITIGGFDASRGGECSVATGSFLLNFRKQLVTANFPGVTFVLTGAPMLTPCISLRSTSCYHERLLNQLRHHAAVTGRAGSGDRIYSGRRSIPDQLRQLHICGADTELANNSVLGPST